MIFFIHNTIFFSRRSKNLRIGCSGRNLEKYIVHHAIDARRLTFNSFPQDASILCRPALCNTRVQAQNQMAILYFRSKLLVPLQFCVAGTSGVCLADNYRAHDCKTTASISPLIPPFPEKPSSASSVQAQNRHHQMANVKKKQKTCPRLPRFRTYSAEIAKRFYGLAVNMSWSLF